MTATRYAVIDIGSNSVQLEISDVLDGMIQTIQFDRIITRLGTGLCKDNRITPSAMLKTEGAIVLQIEAAHQVSVEDKNFRLIATAALRRAENSSDLVDRVLTKCGKHIEIISPEQEAKYACKGVAYSCDTASQNIVVIDIGGGSTEITFATDGNITQTTSLPIGAVTLSSQFDLHDVIDPAPYKRMMQCISDMLDTHVSKVLHIDTLYATGGTCSALTAMELRQDESVLFESHSIDGYVLQLESIIHQLDLLIGLDANGRSKVDGITSDRAEIIVAGASIAKLVLEKLCTDSMTIHTGGIKLGVLLEMIDG